ncbi:MAG TPA: MotA/TolQ/ExbB proton channel family protein [Blastocatellia bacterium]|nr:MotA/TolQ/ExbB proton channel family protein [Blastocatellia bacterium]
MLLLSNVMLAGNKLAFFLLQAAEGGGESPTGGEDLSLWGMIQKMEWPAITVAIVLALMSMYSIAIMVERWLTYNAARNQSRQFAPKVAAALRENRIDEAIAISDRHKKSHLAMVVNAGLQEFQAHQSAGSDIPGTTMDAARRALQRATALKNAELKRGLSGLATIGSTAPFVGLLGTVIGIISAFQGMSSAQGTGISAVAGGISEALIETAFGLLVAIPAVWAFNIFQNKVEAFQIEMDNSSSELVDYFIKRRELR